MGAQGLAFVPVLRKISDSPRADTGEKAAASVALANLGVLNRESIAALALAIRGTNGVRDIVFTAMTFAVRDDWITDEVIGETVPFLERGSPQDFGMAVQALGRVAAHSELARDALLKSLARIRSGPRVSSEGVEIFLRFATARAGGLCW
jgi:hypothetical protein